MANVIYAECASPEDWEVAMCDELRAYCAKEGLPFVSADELVGLSDAQGVWVADFIARCPAWGGDDVCLLVYGKYHAQVARTLQTKMPGATIKTEQGGGWRGRAVYSYSVLEWKPPAEQDMAA